MVRKTLSCAVVAALILPAISAGAQTSAQTPTAVQKTAGTAPTVVTCSSQAGQRQQCPADTSRGVTIGRQMGAACTKDKNWGYDAQGIWVADGCSAEFTLGPAAPQATPAQPEKKGMSGGKKAAIISGIAGAAVVGSVLVAKSGGDDKKPAAQAGAAPTGALSFDSMDANHDGQLSEQEFRTAMAGAFSASDANKDGVLTRDEAGTAWGPRAAAWFDELDAAKKGSIDSTSFAEGTMKVFSAVDKDGNGNITVAERDSARAESRGRAPQKP